MGNITFNYNKDTGYAHCEIKYNNITFTGDAKCLPEDKDFESERTGCFIAEVKANIKKLKYIRKNLRQELKGLTNFQKRLECCNNYNKDNFESKRLRKEIYMYQEQINSLTQAINDEEAYLSKYIKDKDSFYKKMRSHRAV